jgi:hypothetical protein
MNYIDNNIKSVELQTIKRGSHKVLVHWKSGETGSIHFTNKIKAKSYIDFLTLNPNSPIHKARKEFDSLVEQN